VLHKIVALNWLSRFSSHRVARNCIKFADEFCCKLNILQIITGVMQSVLIEHHHLRHSNDDSRIKIERFDTEDRLAVIISDS